MDRRRLNGFASKFRVATNYEEEIVRFVEMKLEHEGS